MNLSDRKLIFSNRNAFLVLGMVEASWAPMIPYIKDRFNLNESDLGLLLLCLGLGSFCALPLVGYLCAKIGCKKLVYISGIIMALSLCSVSISFNLYLCAVMLFIFGMCTIGIDIGANVNGVMVETKLKRPLMSGFHGGYSLGTLVGAGFVSLLLSFGLGIFNSSLIILAFTIITIFLGCQSLYSKVEDPDPNIDSNSRKKKKGFVPILVLVVGCLCFIMYSTEGSVMSWSAVFVNQERGVNIEKAGFVYTSFACTMTIMRLFGNKIVVFFGRRRTVVLGAILVSLGFVLTVVIPHVIGAILGYALVGVGAANIVPQLVSFTGSIKGIHVHTAISFINAFGYSGILLGPVIIGFVAQNFSISTAFLMISFFVLLVALTCLKIMSNQYSK